MTRLAGRRGRRLMSTCPFSAWVHGAPSAMLGASGFAAAPLPPRIVGVKGLMLSRLAFSSLPPTLGSWSLLRPTLVLWASTGVLTGVLTAVLGPSAGSSLWLMRPALLRTRAGVVRRISHTEISSLASRRTDVWAR